MLISFSLLSLVTAGIYLHNPRGSNNRLNEGNADRSNDLRLFDAQNNARGGYGVNVPTPPMSFLSGSELLLDFSTPLCASGSNACGVVVQYYCTANSSAASALIRDGVSLETVAPTNVGETDANSNALRFGLHEPLDHSLRCQARDRNRFLNAVRIAGDSAQFTRQNAGGLRYGFECPEERDYYPYWHPAPWKDLAVLLQNHSAAECARLTALSHNVAAVGHCEPATGGDAAPMADKVAAWKFNTKPACEAGGHRWAETAPRTGARPFCGALPSGAAFTHPLTLPTVADEPACAGGACTCVLRVRLNVTVPAAAAAVAANPLITVAGKPLSLAVNPNHVGRTFEDRSHAFVIRPRPADVPATQRVVNVNVRGKRGNYVQVHPAVEYDFVPRHTVLEAGDAVHFQWTGFDNNPNNGGNNAEGSAGTDRSNICQTDSLASITCLCDDCVGAPPLFATADDRARFALAGQLAADCDTIEVLKQRHNSMEDFVDEDPRNCMKLNAAPAHFDGGVRTYAQLGTMTFMSTRNSNFGNRMQSGSITVVARGSLPAPSAAPNSPAAPAACTSSATRTGTGASSIVVVAATAAAGVGRIFVK